MTCAECDRLKQRLGIDIDLFFHNLEKIPLGSTTLDPLDRQIICASLLGKERNEIAKLISRKPLYIRDRLSDYLYLKIAKLMLVDRDEVTKNWTVILNWLLDPGGEYRLHPPAQLNADNFQASFGSQVFLYPYDRQIGTAQISAAQYYQSGRWYEARRCFFDAWTRGQQIFHSGSPEILIYINNCAIDYNRVRPSQERISVRTIAVVVPIHHDRGQIATETLQGIAQIQLQVNAQIPELGLAELFPNIPPLFDTLPDCKIAIRILIVNDINNLYDGNERTAENLTRLESELNLIAIIGHYSSEATQRALPVYAKAGIVLVNSSSTSTQLSSLGIGEKLCFFRIPPIDTINAAKLVEFLADPAVFPRLPALKKTAIIYAENSIYSNSYRQAIENELSHRTSDFQILSTFGYLLEEDIRASNYIEQINSEEVDIVLIIIDARIDPNFLANTGLLSQLNLDRCVLAGSATMYKQNFGRSILVPSYADDDRQPQIVSCLPWHWDSRVNGCNSDRLPAREFCTLASRLWDANKVTWRSATAFDSVLLIYQMLQQFPHIDDSQSLLEQMDRHFKLEHHQFQGITGQITFQANGDRLDPPAEIVKLKWDRSQGRWQWDCISPV